MPFCCWRPRLYRLLYVQPVVRLLRSFWSTPVRVGRVAAFLFPRAICRSCDACYIVTPVAFFLFSFSVVSMFLGRLYLVTTTRTRVRARRQALENNAAVVKIKIVFHTQNHRATSDGLLFLLNVIFWCCLLSFNRGEVCCWFGRSPP